MTNKLVVTFPAEIKQVSVKKLLSLDKEYRIVLSTEDGAAMNLDAFASDVLVNVTVEAQ